MIGAGEERGRRKGHLPPRQDGRRARCLPLPTLLAAVVLLAVGQPRPAAAGKVEDLSRLLLENDSYKVRVQAAQILVKLGDPAAVGPLSRALGDSNKTVRWMAVQGLGRLGDAKAVPAIKALLGREKDASVRAQAEKALAALSTPGPRKSARIFLTFGSFKGGVRSADQAALEILRGALRRELAKLPIVTFEETRSGNTGSGGPVGFLIDGNVSRLDDALSGSAEINCDVKVMVARWPSKSIILWTSAGAAVQGGGRPQDVANSRRDCLEASAGQLGEDLMKFFQSQGG